MVGRYKVLLSHLDLLINDINLTDTALISSELLTPVYKERAILIFEECLGSDAAEHVTDINKATHLKISEDIDDPSVSLSFTLTMIKLVITSRIDLLEKRLEIRKQLGPYSPATKATTIPVQPIEPTPISNRIFIVHGHDEAMQVRVARTIEQLKLDPVILHEQPNKGRTIIEKFEDEAADVGFAVVLLSPDDEGRKTGDADFYPRARQNVVLELGFFYGKLGRGRVVALYNDAKGFEQPSDLSGVIYIPYDRRGAWRMALCKELQECGYDVSADDL